MFSGNVQIQAWAEALGVGRLPSIWGGARAYRNPHGNGCDFTWNLQIRPQESCRRNADPSFEIHWGAAHPVPTPGSILPLLQVIFGFSTKQFAFWFSFTSGFLIGALGYLHHGQTWDPFHSQSQAFWYWNTALGPSGPPSTILGNPRGARRLSRTSLRPTSRWGTSGGTGSRGPGRFTWAWALCLPVRQTWALDPVLNQACRQTYRGGPPHRHPRHTIHTGPHAFYGIYLQVAHPAFEHALSGGSGAGFKSTHKQGQTSNQGQVAAIAALDWLTPFGSLPLHQAWCQVPPRISILTCQANWEL